MIYKYNALFIIFLPCIHLSIARSSSLHPSFYCQFAYSSNWQVATSLRNTCTCWIIYTRTCREILLLFQRNLIIYLFVTHRSFITRWIWYQNANYSLMFKFVTYAGVYCSLNVVTIRRVLRIHITKEEIAWGSIVHNDFQHLYERMLFTIFYPFFITVCKLT